MFEMLLRSRRYASRFFKRRSWDFGTPQKVPNPYGAGYTPPRFLADGRRCIVVPEYFSPHAFSSLTSPRGYRRGTLCFALIFAMLFSWRRRCGRAKFA